MAFVATSAFAVNFVPTPMTLSAAAEFQYDFDGTPLVLPLTVGGPGGSVFFLVFTNGKASTISHVTNGFLGWHYVNNIDTCLYISPITEVKSGSNNITWDGKNEAGAAVDAGTYTYYIYGFDDVSSRTQVTSQLRITPWCTVNWLTHTEAGAPLDQPKLAYFPKTASIEETVPTTIFRWTVGSDPADPALIESTIIPAVNVCSGNFAYQPTDYNYVFLYSHKKPDINYAQKWQWTPQGEALPVEDWGENGKCTHTYASADLSNDRGPGIMSDGGDYLLAGDGDNYGQGDVSQVVYINVADGTEAKRFDISPWFVDPQAFAGGGQLNGGPIVANIRDNRILERSGCMYHMYDTAYEDAAEATKWVNRNGDYFFDHNFKETSAHKWVCFDYTSGDAVAVYSTSADANLFWICPTFLAGAVSFGIFAPDGSGLGYVALSGETAVQKYGIYHVDYGSVYDGIYCTKNDNEVVDNTFWYVGNDSIKGVITNKPVGVADAPAMFAVAQNVPNPFNPTTTINFNLAKAGKVTVDVYNVAGQKVDTIVNAPMNQGPHSVTWNASKFSAGVYFYTVKSGSFSKTTKMTLLK